MKKIRYIPYGYTMRNGRTVISTEEAEIIREIFKAYLDGASLKAIAEELTGRQIPYTQRTTTWDKARIARIIDNAKYIGTEEYDPIIDEDMYEAAVSLKTARQRNTCEKENDAIDLLRDFVRCDNCGQPMKRRVSMKHRIRESWNCTNDDCGIRVRISDTQLIETITVLINRVILNDHLLQPKPRKRYEPDAKVTKVGNDIALELERDAPNEEYIIEKTIEMAALMYEQSNAKLNLTVLPSSRPSPSRLSPTTAVTPSSSARSSIRSSSSTAPPTISAVPPMSGSTRLPRSAPMPTRLT